GFFGSGTSRSGRGAAASFFGDSGMRNSFLTTANQRSPNCPVSTNSASMSDHQSDVRPLVTNSYGSHPYPPSPQAGPQELRTRSAPSVVRPSIPFRIAFASSYPTATSAVLP